MKDTSLYLLTLKDMQSKDSFKTMLLSVHLLAKETKFIKDVNIDLFVHQLKIKLIMASIPFQINSCEISMSDLYGIPYNYKYNDYLFLFDKIKTIFEEEGIRLIKSDICVFMFEW